MYTGFIDSYGFLKFSGLIRAESKKKTIVQD
jgi:hypothetical protein